MQKIFISVVLALLSVASVRAQFAGGSNIGGEESGFYKRVSGTVVDSVSAEPVAGAVVTLLTSTGNVKNRVRYAVTDRKGAFSFDYVNKDNLKIEITCLGYKIFGCYFKPVGALNMYVGRLRLVPDVHGMEAVTVEARMSFFTIKGDTIQYNPRAVKSLAEDTALDVMSKMPGVEVDGNTVRILGENVQRTYVNGELVYGVDGTPDALVNVKAKDLEAVQTYEEYDLRLLRDTGIKEKRRVLNLLTYDYYVSHTTSDIAASAGCDMDRGADGKRRMRYAAGGGFNFFSEANQLNVGVAVSNTGYERYKGVTKAVQFSSVATSPAGYKREADIGLSWRHTSMETVEAMADGHRLIGREPKSGYSLEYKFGNGAERNSSSTLRDYFPSDRWTSRTEADSSSTAARQFGHSVAGQFSGGERRNRWYFTPRIAYGGRRNDARSESSITLDGNVLARNELTSGDRSRRWSVNLPVSYSFPISRQRDFKVSVVPSWSHNVFSSWSADTLSTSTNRLSLAADAPGDNVKIDVGAGSLLTHDDVRLRIGYEYRFKYESGDRVRTTADNLTGRIDSLLTYDYGLRSMNNEVVLILGQAPSRRFCYRVSFFGAATTERQKDRRYGVDDLSKTWFLPSVAADIGFGDYMTSRFYVRYDYSQSAPALYDLNGRMNYSDPLVLSAGNPSLRPSQTHTVDISWNRMNLNKRNCESSAWASFSRTNDMVGSSVRFFETDTYLPEYDFTASRGAELTCPANMREAAYSAVVRFRHKNYITPLKSILSLKVAAAYDDSPVLIDGAVLRVKSMRPEAELMLTSNFSSKVEITAGGCFIFEHRRSTGASYSRRWIGGLSGRYNPTRRFFINWNYNYMGFAVESAYRVPDVDDHRLDVTAGCRLLADNGLQLSISAFDILNRTTSISSGVMQNCILTRRNVFFGRYWTFNISYKFDRKH